MNRTASNWVALAVGTIVSLAAALGAYQLAQYSLGQLVGYRSIYAKGISETPAPATTAAGASAEARPPRIVLVIIDGLRLDVSREMGTLNSLRDRGYDAVVRTGEPSLSFPTWTTLLSGATQRVSGVTTNWFEERVPVETLVDVSLREGRGVAVAAPSDFETLYGVKRSPDVLLRDWEYGEYLTGQMVDDAISLANESSATVVIVHSPDIDNAGHDFGGASAGYRKVAMKVDKDIGRLVTALQDERTTFVVAADHGHIDAGGHGGWERAAKEVPAVFAGAGVALGKGEGTQDQVAPTVALLAGLPAPRHATALPLPVTAGGSTDAVRFDRQQVAAYDAFTAAVSGQSGAASKDVAAARAGFEKATAERAARERSGRLAVAIPLALAAIATLVAIGSLSWRALAGALAGTAGYYLVYNGLFFLVHGYRWSLSAFNTEDYMKAFFNGRMVEAIIAALIGAFIAGDVYLALRAEPQRPRGEYLPGWLALGTATVLAIQSTLLLQVAWYLWRYGAQLSWLIPDLKWGFKYDLDLIQGTGLGAAALLAPLATWIVGRFHPFRVRTVKPAEDAGA